MVGIRKIIGMASLIPLLVFCTSPAPKASQASELEKTHTESDKLVLVHPEKADAWSTQRAIADNEQPSSAAIEECDLEVSLLAIGASNDQDLIAAKEQLAKDVTKDLFRYHWCFYQGVRTLDTNLANADSTLEQRADEFFESMKALWLLARALQLVTDDDHYFAYLEARYIQVNRDVFGRSVSEMAPPIDERLKAPLARKSGNPPHPVDQDDEDNFDFE